MTLEESLRKIEAGDYARILYRRYGSDRTYEIAGAATAHPFQTLQIDDVWIYAGEEGAVNENIDELLAHTKPDPDLADALVVKADIADSHMGCILLKGGEDVEWLDQDGDEWSTADLSGITVLLREGDVAR